MKKIASVAAFCMTIIAFAVCGAGALDFSAEFVENEFGDVRRGKIYMTADKSRFELEGTEAIEVTRADKNVMWLIFPKRRVYAEEEFIGALPSYGDESAAPKDTGDLSREDLGYETVDSYRLRKYLVTVKYNGGKTLDRYYEWYRADFPIAVKAASESGVVLYEYKKIKFGPQNPNLFNEPKNYKKVTTDELSELEERWKKK